MDELDRLRDREGVRTTTETGDVDADEFDTIRELHEAGLDTSVGALVRDAEGRVAMVRTHWSDGWVVPGGKVEPDEDLREAVVREVREECEA